MSYILEALKKSEQDRKRSDTASIYTVEHRVLPVEKEINIWAWFFLGLVLCNVFWLALYFFVKEPVKPPVTMAPPAAQTSAQEAAALTPGSAAPSASASGSQIIAPVNASVPLHTPTSPRQQAEGSPRSAQNQVMTEKAIVKTYRDFPPEDEYLGVPIYETIGPRQGTVQSPKFFPSPYHLPPEIQQQLPSMRFDSHLYSEDANFRSVIVNGQLLHENDWVSDDLLLLKITELGVILRFGSYSFQMPIVEGWVNESQR